MGRLLELPVLAALLAVTALASGCGGGGGSTGPPGESVPLTLELEGLPPLDPASEGDYEAWVVGADGSLHSAGHFQPGSSVSLRSPLASPADIMITVEPPGDTDDRPSQQKLLGGRVSGGTASLSVEDYVTAGVPLETRPGTHALFTPSDNAELGYPSNEDSGLWLFNVEGDTISGDFYLSFTPLTRGWTYEGWIVRGYGSASECWISYGKFEPNRFGKLERIRDDTGLGPFSGQIDYERAMPEEIVFPGDDWVSNPLGFDVPCGLELPLDLNGDADAGVESPWTHVITIEPRTEDEEAPVGREPFLLRPYRNPFGEGGPGDPRTIEFHPEDLPSGTARIGG